MSTAARRLSSISRSTVRLRSFASVSSPPPKNRRAVDLGLIAAGGVAVSGLLLWSSRRGKDDKMGAEDERPGPAFTIPYESQCVPPPLLLAIGTPTDGAVGAARGRPSIGLADQPGIPQGWSLDNENPHPLEPGRDEPPANRTPELVCCRAEGEPRPSLRPELPQ